MRKPLFLALVCAAGLVAAKKTTDAAREFLQQIPKQNRIEQALNRLTFGPRPDDAEVVREMGLKKWIDRQLHPESIPESPAVLEKLKYMDTLQMSSAELVKNYPTPQMVRQMIAGQAPLPTDPERRAMVQKLMERASKKRGQDDKPNLIASERPALADILTQQEIRSLRTGSPEERMAAFESLPTEKRDAVVAVLPQGMRQQLSAVASPELRRKLTLANGPQQVVARDLMESKVIRAIHSERQLNEILVDFWFNHFNVYLDKGADRFLTTEYERDAIRPHVLGRFRDLLGATAKSPAMLFYLDNWQSVGENAPQVRSLLNRPRGQRMVPGATAIRPGGATPAGTTPNRPRRGLNENYGRELLELHTLGVDGGYTQKDVTEVARCFTGWTINQPHRGGAFIFAPRLHDNGEKVVLGVTIPAGGGMRDGEMVLDLIARHPSTAKFISHKLAQRFVADEPPATLVDRMAEVFLKSGGDLREVMEAMLDSKEFWSAGAFRSKMKSPLEMVTSAVRAVNGNVESAQALVNQLTQLGQPLYRKQEPTGYSNVGQDWVNSAGLLARMNFALQLADGKTPGVTVTAASPAVALGSPEFQKH